MCSCCLIKRQKYIYISGIILTLLLPEYHLKTTDKNVKFDILKPFFFFLILASDRISVKTHSIKIDLCGIGLENILFVGMCVNFLALEI